MSESNALVTLNEIITHNNSDRIKHKIPMVIILFLIVAISPNRYAFGTTEITYHSVLSSFEKLTILVSPFTFRSNAPCSLPSICLMIFLVSSVGLLISKSLLLEAKTLPLESITNIGYSFWELSVSPKFLNALAKKFSDGATIILPKISPVFSDTMFL